MFIVIKINSNHTYSFNSCLRGMFVSKIKIELENVNQEDIVLIKGARIELVQGEIYRVIKYKDITRLL